jgi:hypothetical protein
MLWHFDASMAILEADIYIYINVDPRQKTIKKIFHRFIMNKFWPLFVEFQ